jgi:hypothetical protein
MNACHRSPLTQQNQGPRYQTPAAGLEQQERIKDLEFQREFLLGVATAALRDRNEAIALAELRGALLELIGKSRRCSND